MPHDMDSRLATAAVLAHGALNSLSLLRHAYRVLDESCDKTAWSEATRELVESVPEQIDLTVDSLRLIVSGFDAPAADFLDRLNSLHTIELISTEELEHRLAGLFEKRLDRQLTQEERREYERISEELNRRRQR